MCEFEPDIERPGQTTSVVATCGGDSVCFIDCKSGKVIKKYKEPGEEFYCITWTILNCRNELTGEEKRVTMLAAAGVLGDIKLIETSQLVCYQQLSHHDRPIDALMFHPNNPNWLFSKSDHSVSFIKFSCLVCLTILVYLLNMVV